MQHPYGNNGLRSIGYLMAVAYQISLMSSQIALLGLKNVVFTQLSFNIALISPKFVSLMRCLDKPDSQAKIWPRYFLLHP